jgi:hypothetical protein
MNIESYNAEDFINLIEQERFDKISNYGMELIAIRFRELQNQGQTLPIDSVVVTKGTLPICPCDNTERQDYGDGWNITCLECGRNW